MKKGLETDGREGMEKRELKMMREKKEFPKGEFSGFRCVLECSKTRCVFSAWLDSFFIVVGVDLGLMVKIFLIHIFYIFCIFLDLHSS